jgi:hypothetical protein
MKNKILCPVQADAHNPLSDAQQDGWSYHEHCLFSHAREELDEMGCTDEEVGARLSADGAFALLDNDPARQERQLGYAEMMIAQADWDLYDYHESGQAEIDHHYRQFDEALEQAQMIDTDHTPIITLPPPPIPQWKRDSDRITALLAA